MQFFSLFLSLFENSNVFINKEARNNNLYSKNSCNMAHENTIGFGSKYREKNEQQEAWVANYLDTYFYPRISSNFERNYDTETQKLGIDLRLTGKTQVITIDEKASVEWCNVGLNKYSMELSLLSVDKYGNEKEISGWYMKNNLSDHIAIIFIDSATTVNNRFLTGSGITEATVVIINKQNFQKKLDLMGWNKANLKKKNDMIRKAYNVYGSDYKKYINCGTLNYNTPHFFILENTKEHGINIQFTQQFLIDNSEYAAKIKDNKVLTIKR